MKAVIVSVVTQTIPFPPSENSTSASLRLASLDGDGLEISISRLPVSSVDKMLPGGTCDLTLEIANVQPPV